MAEHTHNAQTLMERDALYPTEPKTEEVIIPGYDNTEVSAESSSEVEFSPAQVLDRLFDSYVNLMHNPYRAGFGEPTHESVVELRRKDLHFYVQTAFTQNDISIDSELLPKGQPFTVDAIVDALVNDGIIRATSRYDESTYNPAEVDLPVHVRPEVAEEESAPNTNDNIFLGYMKQFGAKAMKMITLHSTEVTLPQTRMLPTLPIDIVQEQQKTSA